mgnify:CR=1 FL=1
MLEQFPILGGRLLKKELLNVPERPESFPILGGRLLKPDKRCNYGKSISVSNPWREAIEANRPAVCTTDRTVSNPWREAIEAGLDIDDVARLIRFPILGGRLLKKKK